MLANATSLVQHRFIVRMWTAAGLCALFSVSDVAAFRLFHLRGLPAYLIGALPGLPIVGQLLATGAYLKAETDEFPRAMLVQSLLGGTGATLAAITTWGYLEDFAQTPHLDLVWAYPLFWLFTALSYYVVRARYR